MTIVLNLLVTGETLDLVNFIYSSFFVSFKLIGEDNHNILYFVLNKLKSLLDLVLFGIFVDKVL